MTLLLALLLTQDAVQHAVEKIRKGETPDSLAERKEPEVLDAIAARVLEKKACPDAVLLHLCANAARSHADALLELLDDPVKIAYEAVFALSTMLDEKLVAALEPKLDGARDLRIRAFTVLAESRFAGAAPAIEKRLNLLDPADRELSKAVLRAVAGCRVRAAHDAVLAYYEKTDPPDDQAVRALGRIWEMKLDAKPLERKDEIRRLTTELMIRRLVMSAASTEVQAEALLRILTKEEFEKFLKDFATEKFVSRREFAAAAMARGFDRAKGIRLVEAFLANPDPSLVSRIVVLSPYPIPKEALAKLLFREEDAKIDEAPGASRVCDLAAWRLSKQIDRKDVEIPAEVEKRNAIVQAWKERLTK